MSKHTIFLPAVAAAIALLATPALGADKDKPEHLYGPEPTWEQFRSLAEAGIQARLIDPESARISWSAGFFKGMFRPFLEGRYHGYVACGTVNARNRMGGYAGASGFVVVIDYDRVLYAAIERVLGGLVEAPCAKMARAGQFPPLPAGAITASVMGAAPAPVAVTAAAPNTPTATVSAASGLSLRAMPDGAYISAVTPDSPAALAGLKPGMVVASVNAIPLAGMGDAMLKVVDAAGVTASLAIVGGRTVTLGAKP
ncbi:PDZ domain-containing protein [Sphingomonas rubra]|uniref:PDZ domain-containing protein n=1 Tax=Sphingomonas rubra TaxID=634430 RepID=A0A1I5TNP6_9SPHN|nr:PDZ domain-containing protein [Sphingomonas rubra]SFP84227.1 hypothetical protein SAMN04488241_108149 [Sphingomonas rubra]